jgi:hypothetical protein
MKCPQHACTVCDGRAANRGGLLFRCTDCPTTVCETCLPDSFDAVDKNEIAAVLGYVARSIEYIRCSACYTRPPNALFCRMHGLPIPKSGQARPSKQQSGNAPSEGRGKGRQMVSARPRQDPDQDFIGISDVNRGSNSNAGVLSSAASRVPGKTIQPDFMGTASDLGGVCEPASLIHASPDEPISPIATAGRKRHLDSESAVEGGRPTRRCAVVGADARLARQLQESRMQSLQDGPNRFSPEKARITGDDFGVSQRHASVRNGMGEVEAQEAAWSSAQTPTTPSIPLNRYGRSMEGGAQVASLVFPSDTKVQCTDWDGEAVVAAKAAVNNASLPSILQDGVSLP